MKQVFTDQNMAIVGSVRSYLREQGIACQLRNEFSSSVMGEVAFFLVWPELWVADDSAHAATALVNKIRKPITEGSQWQCKHCDEQNPGTFETCWQCAKTA